MSRSAFADRFSAVVGTSPLSYLTQWRLHVAASLLRGSNLGVSEIASQVGYDSDASLSRAFRRELGEAPGQYRRKFLYETRAGRRKLRHA